MELQKLKYPIGEYVPKKNPDRDQLDQWIIDIETFPSKLMKVAKHLSTETLAWKYRPDGWTVKQVVHHCADSHMNSVMRFKLTLTEETPTIRPYFEDRWADLLDAQSEDILASLMLLEGLHKRWVVLLKGLTVAQLKLEFVHPDHGLKFSLAENIGFYAWHCNHHLSHVKNGIESNGIYN